MYDSFGSSRVKNGHADEDNEIQSILERREVAPEDSSRTHVKSVAVLVLIGFIALFATLTINSIEKESVSIAFQNLI